MRFLKNNSDFTLTFHDGYLHKVEQYVRGKKSLKKVKVKDVQFLYDMWKYTKTQRIPIMELMQWIKHRNESVTIEVVSATTLKLNNIKL